jgi:hypothetical protein
MNIRNPLDPRKTRAAGGTYSAAKQRRQRRPLGTHTANECSVLSKDQKSVEGSVLIAVAKFDGKSKVTTGATECIKYKGYTFKIELQRAGWKVTIFPKGSPFALHRIAYTSEVAGRDVAIEQAKAIVDEATADKNLHKVAIESAENPTSWSLTLVAFFLRFRRPLLQGWATLKRVYFSVDQPPRASS